MTLFLLISPDTNGLILVGNLVSKSAVPVVRGDGLAGGAIVPLGAAFRRQVLVVTRVLGNLEWIRMCDN